LPNLAVRSLTNRVLPDPLPPDIPITIVSNTSLFSVG